jgi:Predicted nucleoside-diphosphate sugar epimerases
MRYFLTGITGTFGRACVDALLADPETERIIGLSRSGHRRAQLLREIRDSRVECWLGDIRNPDRLFWAARVHPDVLIHAAAEKLVDACEVEPEEAFQTNVLGTLYLVKQAILADIPKVLILSSDKACSPETVYGATKLMAEQLALGVFQAKRGSSQTKVSVARYGNVLGSAGSVLSHFFEARASGGAVRMTDPEATRFWWSIEEAVAFALRMIQYMHGGEIFIPKLTSSRVSDLARAIAPNSTQDVIGMRGPEKQHEAMINSTEARYTFDCGDYYMLVPPHGCGYTVPLPVGARPVSDGFRYTSDQDPQKVEFLCG